MVQYNPLQYLPTDEDLPETDNIPVDNELQILIPSLLRAVLVLLWADRTDWFFGVNLGLYYDPRSQTGIGPDAFLSLGVDRFKPNGRLRLSYLVWQEKYVMPQWVLEVISKSPGSEYDLKLAKYAELGVLYYTIYNPDYRSRDNHSPFEVYRLVDGVYVPQPGEIVWMPELGIGIGHEQDAFEGYNRDWLFWYDQEGNRYPTPEDVIKLQRQQAALERQQAWREREQTLREAEQALLGREQAEQQLEQERQLRENLLRKLREQGIDPDAL